MKKMCLIFIFVKISSLLPTNVKTYIRPYEVERYSSIVVLYIYILKSVPIIYVFLQTTIYSDEQRQSFM